MGGSIQPRSPLKFTLAILLYAEPTLMSKIFATASEFTLPPISLAMAIRFASAAVEELVQD
jgi:hypothetical protein